MHRLKILCASFLLLLFSCKNELDGIIEGSYDCYGNITNVQQAFTSLNDCPLMTGLPGSNYKLVAEFDHGECLDSNTVIIDRIVWYNSQEEEVSHPTDVKFNYGAFYPVGNKIITNLCIRFGSQAKYVEVYMITANMLQSNNPKTGHVVASKIRINKPEGGN